MSSSHRTFALDAASHRTLVGFGVRACLFGGVMVMPGLFGLEPGGTTAEALQLACVVGALLGIMRAARQGHVLAKGSLNAWDEAIAFWGLLMLLHWLERSVA